ncbi:hypothetical protein QJS04_geneDACA015112 [Acorus gramineus]|uniref:Uncharacterized protein n=1 Tax=Acorus gramineus TaxID=55184 RepID=A0AAV9BTS7_ACOGR|nr:hypothetical protein QJS04_geneDACA015112 [Acorus gramineus]
MACTRSSSSSSVLVVALIAMTVLFMEVGAAYDRRLHSVEPAATIGYGPIGRGGIPCSKQSHQEGNFRPAAVANPPSRGCEPVESCRGGAGPPALKA